MKFGTWFPERKCKCLPIDVAMYVARYQVVAVRHYARFTLSANK